MTELSIIPTLLRKTYVYNIKTAMYVQQQELIIIDNKGKPSYT